jgi:uncharacterized protein YjbJ (UPF0337 family)
LGNNYEKREQGNAGTRENHHQEYREMTDKKDLATEGSEDRLRGAAKQVEGRVRNAVGGLTGNTGEQVKGKGQELKGKVQETAGKAKQRLDPNPGVDGE